MVGSSRNEKHGTWERRQWKTSLKKASGWWIAAIEDAYNGGDGVVDEEATADAEAVDDGEETVDVGVQGDVASEVEVVGIDFPA